MRDTRLLSTDANGILCPPPSLAPVANRLSAIARPASPAAVTHATRAIRARCRAWRVAAADRGGRVRLSPPGPAPAATASAGAWTASWIAAARSPQKSSALGGGSGVGSGSERSSAARSESTGLSEDSSRTRYPLRRAKGTSSSRGPIQSPSRTTLVRAGVFRLPSFCGPSLSTPLTTPCRYFCAYPVQTVRTRRYSLTLI